MFDNRRYPRRHQESPRRAGDAGGGEIPPGWEGQGRVPEDGAGGVGRGGLEVGSGWVFPAASCRGCSVSRATGHEMRGISSEHPPSACGMFSPSLQFLPLFGPFPKLGRRGVPMSHLLPSPGVTPCPKAGSSAVPSYRNRESGRLLAIAATSSL